MKRSLLFPESTDPSQYSSVTETSNDLYTEGQSSYTDVTLISSDKIRIPAVRSQLSTNSSYFDALLNSEFSEEDHPHIPMSVQSPLLREILDFVTDSNCDRLQRINDRIRSANGVRCDDAEAIVDLGVTADYMCIEKLLNRCESVLQYVMPVQPHLACAIVRALGYGCFSWGQELIQKAVKTTLSHPEEALLLEYRGCVLKCGLLHLDATGAEVMFASVKSKKTEQAKLFQALIVWSTGGTALLKRWKRPSWADCKIMIDTDSIQILEDRRESATRMAKWFDLASLSPAYLSNLVDKRDLVGENALYLAYAKQAEQMDVLASEN